MFSLLLPQLILVVSQTSLSLMLVVLGIVLIGVLFGRLIKTKESLLRHRWSVSIAAILSAGAILTVMMPSAFNFYIDPNLQAFSSLSIITLLHTVIGAPAIVLGLIYTLGDLPKKAKVWMRWAAAFWLVSFVLGLMVFLELMGYLPF